MLPLSSPLPASLSKTKGLGTETPNGFASQNDRFARLSRQEARTKPVQRLILRDNRQDVKGDDDSGQGNH